MSSVPRGGTVTIMRNIKYATLLFFAMFPIVILAQDDNVHGAIRTESGFLIVWNQPKNNFTLNVNGKDFEQIPNKNLAFLINGKFLQITAAFKKDFLTPGQEKQSLNETGILLAHKDWESNYLEQIVHETLKTVSEPVKLSNNQDALLWSFLVPESSKSEVKRQVFLTVVNGESVVVLNGAVTATVDEATVRKFLFEVAVTLKPSKKPISRESSIKLASKTN